jgi:hypothetical protein
VKGKTMVDELSKAEKISGKLLQQYYSPHLELVVIVGLHVHDIFLKLIILPELLHVFILSRLHHQLLVPLIHCCC